MFKELFKELANFGLERDWKQAIAFYIAYLLVLLVLAYIGGMIVGVIMSSTGAAPDQLYRQGSLVGWVVALAGSLTLTFRIVSAKGIKGFQVILYLLGTLALCMVGAIGGILVPAFLTTRKQKA